MIGLCARCDCDLPMTCTCDDPVYGTCDECGRVGYEIEACQACGAEICPFCDHWCNEGDY